MELWEQAKHVYRMGRGLLANIREGDSETIKQKVYKRLSQRRIPILSRYAGFRIQLAPKKRFALDAMDELDAFLLSGARLRMPQSTKPRITVLLILFNKAELTYLCLRSLAALHGEDELDILIIDNGSSDLTAKLLTRIDGARIHFNAENLGFLRACNQGRDMTDAQYLLLLNNDTIVYPGSIGQAARALDEDPKAGAIGARIVLPDGTLQEAGSIIWNDGTALGYARGQHKTFSDAMFRRQVDYCSGAFLMTRTALFKEVGGFDERYIPAYYEETDYCVTLHERGYHILYDPRVVITHFEFGSSVMSERTMQLMATNAVKFREKHAHWLAGKYPPGTNPHIARSTRRTGPRILIVDDRVPHKYWGAGFPRTNRIVELLHRQGYEITILVTDYADTHRSEIYSDVPIDVEVVISGTTWSIKGLLQERPGFYDIVWFSRPNNFEYFFRHCRHLWESRSYALVYDAEAIFAEREALESKVTGRNIAKVTGRSFASEMRMGAAADLIVSVKDTEAKIWHEQTGKPSLVIGHDAEPEPCPESFEERRDILFLGSMHGATSPNTDSLIWFYEAVYPKLRARLGDGVKVRSVGFVSDDAREVLRAKCPGLELVGRVGELTPYLGSHRLMIVPTRYAAGIPQKVFDAAVAGLPVVCSELIAGQMNWRDGIETLAAPTDDGTAFAAKCAELYESKDLWERLRHASIESMRSYQKEGGIEGQLGKVLAEVGRILEAKKMPVVAQRAHTPVEAQ